MTKPRTIFIGDIHGCYKEFKLLLKKVNLQENDKVYLVGDLISKGPKGFKVLKYVYKRQEQFKFVLGNYEMYFLNWLSGKSYKYDKSNFEKIKEKFEKHPGILDFLKNTPLYIEDKNFILIHGGLIPGKDLKDHNIEEITKIREYKGKPWFEYYNGDKMIFYGHSAIEGLRVGKNTIGLDSGCVYGKWLTAYILETGEIFSQSALDTYVNVYKRKILKNETIKTEEL